MVRHAIHVKFASPSCHITSTLLFFLRLLRINFTFSDTQTLFPLSLFLFLFVLVLSLIFPFLPLFFPFHSHCFHSTHPTIFLSLLVFSLKVIPHCSNFKRRTFKLRNSLHDTSLHLASHHVISLPNKRFLQNFQYPFFQDSTPCLFSLAL